MATKRVLAGRYRQVRVLGRGAMGEVWLAEDLELDRLVAIKTLRVESLGSDPAAVDRMVREARVAARLRHRHAVVVFDLVREDGQPHVVMEYVDGEALAERLQRDGTLELAEAARLIAQVADALAEAHRIGILHRDVKPANILIDSAGEARLADFGIARGSGDTVLTATGEFMGTVAYMAPEVAREGLHSEASDVWSLGATLYAAIEGHAPYEGDGASGAVQILTRLATEPVPAPVEAGHLTPLLISMLAAEPQSRPLIIDVVQGLVEPSGSSEPTPVVPTVELVDQIPQGTASTIRRPVSEDTIRKRRSYWVMAGSPPDSRRARKGATGRRAIGVVAGLLAVVFVALIAAGAGVLYLRSQWYVAADHGNVAVYRGINGHVFGVSTSRLSTRSNLPASALPLDDRLRLADGISASGRSGATSVVSSLRSESCAPFASVPSPEPTPGPTPAPIPGWCSSSDPTKPQDSSARLPHGLLGTFEYATTGQEQTSIPGTRRVFPETTRITNASKGCGVRSTWRPISEHLQSQLLCSSDGALKVESYKTTSSFFGVESRESFACSGPSYLYLPNAAAGQTWEYTCRSADSTAKTRVAAIGYSTMSVLGSSVRVLHVRVRATLEGMDTGVSTQDYWIGTQTPVIVEAEGQVSETQQGVHYSESYRLRLDRRTSAE